MHSSFVGLDLFETLEDSPVKEEVKKPIEADKVSKVKAMSVSSCNTSIKDYFEVIDHLPKMESNMNPELKHQIVEILEPTTNKRHEAKNDHETIDTFMLNVKKRLRCFEAPKTTKFQKTYEFDCENDDVVEKLDIPETQSSPSENTTILINESPLQPEASSEVQQFTNPKDTDEVIHSQLKQELIVNEDFRDLNTDQHLEVWNYLKPSFVKKNTNLGMDSTLFRMKFNRINNVMQLHLKKKDFLDKKLIPISSPNTKIRSIPKPLIPMTPIQNSSICNCSKTPLKQILVVGESFETPVAKEVLIEISPKPALFENIVLNEMFDSYVKRDSIPDLISFENVSDNKNFVKQQLKAEINELNVAETLNLCLPHHTTTSMKMNLADTDFAIDFLASMDAEEKITKSSTQINGIFINTPSLSETAKKIKKSQLMLTGLKVCENIVLNILDQKDETTIETNGHLDYLFEQNLKPLEDNERTTSKNIHYKDETEDVSISWNNSHVIKPKAKVPSTSRAIGELQLLHENFRSTRNISTLHDNTETVLNPSGSGQKKIQMQNHTPLKKISIKDDRQEKLYICKQKLNSNNDVDSYLNNFIRVKFSDGF